MIKKLAAVTELKKQLDKKRPLSPQLVESLRQDFLIKNTYHSNAIEGNTLTIYETKAILEDGVTIAKKSMREHLEAINHKEAILVTEDIVRKQEPFSERMIKNLHAIILHGIDSSFAGIYRNEDVIISGASHTPPHYYLVDDQMKGLIEWYHTFADLHPVEKAAILHSKLVNIHPFKDGNGRTSRLVMNLELMKNGYLPVNIEKDDRFKYYEVLDIAAVTTNYQPFINFIANYEKESLSRYLSLIN